LRRWSAGRRVVARTAGAGAGLMMGVWVAGECTRVGVL
jgi:hypothetical protein